MLLSPDLGVGVHIRGPTSREAEAEGRQQIQGQLGLHSETLSPNKNKNLSFSPAPPNLTVLLLNRTAVTHNEKALRQAS